MPPAFQFGGESDLIVLQRIRRPGSRGFGHQGVARLKPGVTIEQANADINRMIPLWQKDTSPNRSRFAGSLRPLKQDIVGNIGPALWVILGTIGAVLLMACANVANLLLIRADARRQEFAIRAALAPAGPASSDRCSLRACCLVSPEVRWACYRVRRAACVPRDRAGESASPRRDLDRCAGVGLRRRGIDHVRGHLRPHPILKFAGGRDDYNGSGCRSHGHAQSRTATDSEHPGDDADRAGAGVAGELRPDDPKFQALRSVEPGFTEPHAVQTFSLFVPANQGTELNLEGGASTAADEQLVRTQQAIGDKLAAIPGVESVAFTSYLSMDPDTSTRASDALEGESGDNPKLHVSRQFRFISPGLFEAMGTRLVAGVDFTWTDMYDRRDVAIVSENFARELWGRRSRTWKTDSQRR